MESPSRDRDLAPLRRATATESRQRRRGRCRLAAAVAVLCEAFAVGAVLGGSLLAPDLRQLVDLVPHILPGVRLNYDTPSKLPTPTVGSSLAAESDRASSLRGGC